MFWRTVPGPVMPEAFDDGLDSPVEAQLTKVLLPDPPGEQYGTVLNSGTFD